MIDINTVNETVEALEKLVDYLAEDDKELAGKAQTLLNFWRLYRDAGTIA